MTVAVAVPMTVARFAVRMMVVVVIATVVVASAVAVRVGICARL